MVSPQQGTHHIGCWAMPLALALLVSAATNGSNKRGGNSRIEEGDRQRAARGALRHGEGFLRVLASVCHFLREEMEAREGSWKMDPTPPCMGPGGS